MRMTKRDIWQSVEMNGQGISVTTYSQPADGMPVVEDETWYTWDEIAAAMEENVTD